MTASHTSLSDLGGAVEEVARLIEESSLGTVGARQLRDRADGLTVARIRARTYFDEFSGAQAWWNENQRNSAELLRKSRELAAAGEMSASSVLALVASGLPPSDAQSQGTGCEAGAQQSAPTLQEAARDWRTFEVFYHREIDSLIKILCERADLPLNLGRKLIVQAMVKAFDNWEHLAASSDPAEWVIGCALQFFKSRGLPTEDDSWTPVGSPPTGIDVTALSPTHPPHADTRVAGALAVAASEVPNSAPAVGPGELCPTVDWSGPREQIPLTGHWSWSCRTGGDETSADQAVVKFYSQHYQPLVRLAALLVTDIGTAEDVVMDSFVAMHGAWQRLRYSEKALSYLRQSVVNRARSVLRHRAAEARNTATPSPPSPDVDDDETITLLERSAVIAALRKLPPRQREALVLKYYADLSETQIAAAMGVSRGAVKSHTTRGMTTLRVLLELR